jgi:proteasome lid subunit RPN8/RPN11
MSSLANGIHLEQTHWHLMEADVNAKCPEEACGLVIGTGNDSKLVVPVTNILHSPVKFRMDPQEELNAFYLAEQNGWDILAIYHSHPQGKGEPSPTDMAELSFPGTIYLIWYYEFNDWRCRGFLMYPGEVPKEVPVRIIAKSQ